MVIVADENIPYLHAFFSRYGKVVPVPGRHLSAADVQQAQALLVRSVTRVNPALVQHSPVQFVGTCTIGVDHLDLPYLQQRGIQVASAPGCNAGGVVQYVLAALAQLRPNWRQLRIGIVGCGNVGGRLYDTLAQAGVQLCVFDPFKISPQRHFVPWETLLEMDVICLHTPLTRTGAHPTFHLITQHTLNALKPGTLLLNAGRGEVIDNKALLQHLSQGAQLDVVLDVWENEPDILQPLVDWVRIATPHIAGYSFEGRVNGTTYIHRAFAEFLGVPPADYLQHEAQVLADVLGEPQAISPTGVNDALLSTYPILEDDQRFRALLAAPQAFAKGFDALRKHYPKRRECAHFRLPAATPQAPCLQALGFTLEPAH